MMWELIAANRRKSIALFVGMAATLCVLGYVIGEVVVPDGGGYLGLMFAVAIWVLLSAVSLIGGSNMILSMSGARLRAVLVRPRRHPIVRTP